jgi:threonine aldolase
MLSGTGQGVKRPDRGARALRGVQWYRTALQREYSSRMRSVDLRSDTVTLPSAAMRKAMADAELGDDVFGEDPTVNKLQELAAERMGKEAAIFVSSGTMGNLIGMLVNARRGQEVIVDDCAHVLLSEAASVTTLGGIQLRTVTADEGTLRPEVVEPLIRPIDDVHQPQTAAISVENTHNRYGGAAYSMASLDAIAGVAERHALAVHMDGARIFNAALATGVDVGDVAAAATTVTFCFSKGLGCPAGSMLCGPAEKIHEAFRWRKMLGGSMRQVGVLAAAGLYALDNMVDRLAEDHANAKAHAEGMSDVPGIVCDASRVQTNIVLINLVDMPADEFVAACAEQGVRCGARSRRQIRFVTHYGIDADDISYAIDVARRVMSSSSRFREIAPGLVAASHPR